MPSEDNNSAMSCALAGKNMEKIAHNVLIMIHPFSNHLWNVYY